MINKRILPFTLTVIIILSSLLSGCSREETKPTDYSKLENWTYLNVEDDQKLADVFFIAPTAYASSEGSFNMPMTDIKARESFVGVTNMEMGIYNETCRFFAPFYQQASISVYSLSPSEREKYLKTAYEDVKTAFEYYMSNYNNGRPIVLAGFSQGADMCIRLLKDCFKNETTNALLVACYAIGWGVTEEELAQYPHLKCATGQFDTGVIVSFNTEEEGINDSLMIPSGTKTVSINPLNWKTDGTRADKSLNLGACFTNAAGDIESEVSEFTGAYIDTERGALKVTDVDKAQYPASDIFPSGVYHLYDWQFFYRNLQQNVNDRVTAFIKE